MTSQRLIHHIAVPLNIMPFYLYLIILKHHSFRIQKGERQNTIWTLNYCSFVNENPLEKQLLYPQGLSFFSILQSHNLSFARRLYNLLYLSPQKKEKGVVSGININPHIPLSQMTVKTSFVCKPTNYNIEFSKVNQSLLNSYETVIHRFTKTEAGKTFTDLAGDSKIQPRTGFVCLSSRHFLELLNRGIQLICLCDRLPVNRKILIPLTQQ